MEEYLDNVRQQGIKDSRDECGIPTLCSAIDKYRSANLVEELLKDGIDVNTVSIKTKHTLSCNTWRTRYFRWGNFAPIHLAVSLGLHKVVKLLGQYGADLTSKTANGIVPVDFLLNDFKLRCLEKNESVSKADDYEILKLIHAGGVDLNTSCKQTKDTTLLHRSVEMNNLDIIKYLISAKCEVNSICQDGKTPLLYWNLDSLECARILLQNNADPNWQDNFGENIYHCAVSFKAFKKRKRENSILDILHLLHEFRVHPNVCNNKGETPLHIAFKYANQMEWNEDVIDAMLEHGADLNLRDRLGRTPMYNFIRGSNPTTQEKWNTLWSILIKYINHGARLDNVDITGVPLLHQLFESPLLRTESFIINAKSFTKIFQTRCNVPLNSRDIYKRTILHLVSAQGNWKIGEILINHGSDVKMRDCDGNTPLDVAILSKQWRFARELLRLPSDDQRFAENCSQKGCDYFKGNLDARNRFTQIQRCKSIPNLAYQDDCIKLNHAQQHNFCMMKAYSCYELHRNTTENDKSIPRNFSLNIQFKERENQNGTSVRDNVDWSTKTLDIIAHYVGKGNLIPIESGNLESPFDENITDPPPKISDDLVRKISKSSLYELCEKNSVGRFHLKEECEEEHCLVLKQVFVLVSDLVRILFEIDPRFNCKLFWGGSSAEGTKMWLPDEFDLLMELVELRNKCHFNKNEELIVNEEELKSWSSLCRHKSRFLSMRKLKTYITTLLWKAAFRLDRKKYANILYRLSLYDGDLQTFIQRTKVGTKLTVYWLGETYKKLLISIDLTPAILIPLSKEQLSNIRQQGVERLVDNNIYAVPYVNYFGEEEWRTSFCLTEVQVMKNLPRKQLALYKAMKFFRDIHKSHFEEIPSYHLKIFLFNYLFLDSSSCQSGSAKNDEFYSNFYHILERLNTIVCSERDVDKKIDQFFLGYSLPLRDYDMRWVQSTLDILSKCK